MKVLFIVGSNLRVNTSANLCHIAYIDGCVKDGNDVDVISMSEGRSSVDESIKLPKVSNWYTFAPPRHNNIPVTTEGNTKKNNVRQENKLKKFILKFYGIYGHTASIWVKRAKKFKSSQKYDRVISLATPYVSHYLAYILIHKKRVKCDKWIQIWEDPWTFDLYNADKSERIKKEESKLLSFADEVIYCSPITLKYQRNEFPEYSKKMTWHTLPYYYKNTTSKISQSKENVFGYYGDYYSFSRNLQYFYDAAKEADVKTKIYGDSDLSIEKTDNIDVRPRVNLKELKKAEDETDVLVFLCNLKGGQIPGKLYQYSATNKPILFILDGTVEEVKVIQEYFSQFNRYIFCENNVLSISREIKNIRLKKFDGIRNHSVEKFSPEKTMQFILNA